MKELVYMTNMGSKNKSISDSTIKKFKLLRNPTLSFFGPQSYDAVSSYWQSHAYDLYEYGRIIDTDSFAARAFNKKSALMFKNGYTIASENEKNAEYVVKRLNEIGYVTGKPFDIFLKETAMNLITFHNAYIVKVRKLDASTGAMTQYGNVMKEPIAGLFNIPPETVHVKCNDRGKVVKYREYISPAKFIEYSPDEIIHIYFNKRTGFLMGTPPLEPVKDDILALRRIEESIETLIYKSLFPIVHVKVGTEKNPAKKFPDGTSEVDIATSYLKNIEDDGGIVTNERVDMKAIGAESLALRVEGYLNYFRDRVFIGLGMSSIDFGLGDSSGRATGEALSESIKESVMSYQDTFQTFISEFIIKVILYESGKYKNLYSIPEKDMVYFEFNDLDVATKMKIESHELNKFTQGLQSVNETRIKSGLKKMSEEEVKSMQKQQQYDPNQEASLAMQKQQANTAAGKRTSGSKQKAKGSSSLTKSIVKPKNQNTSDMVNGIINILDSNTPMYRGRLYNYITANITDTCSLYNEDVIVSAVTNIINIYATHNRDNLEDKISNELLYAIFNI